MWPVFYSDSFGSLSAIGCILGDDHRSSGNK
jgi:hypothetical protein